MSENMSTVITLILLVAAFVGLVFWVRRDTFATKAQDSEVDDTYAGLPEPRRLVVVPGTRNRVLQVTTR